MYIIFFINKRGGHTMRLLPDSQSALKEMERLFRRRITARAERDGEIVGRVDKVNGKWNWGLYTGNL